MYVCCMYNNGKEQTHRICNDVAFASFDHFATVNPPVFTAQSGSFNRLTINEGQTRRFISPCFFAYFVTKQFMYLFDDTSILSFAEIVLN